MTGAISPPGLPPFRVFQVDHVNLHIDMSISVPGPVREIAPSFVEARAKTLFPPDFVRGNSF
jgi:hypothetical protein